MGRLVHLSDLHFGRDRPGLAAALAERIRALAPDVTVISGDLTQRALQDQYLAASDFAAALPGPVLVVPGNHDIPLYNPLARLCWPFRAWRRAFPDTDAPVVTTPDLCVVGMNTADPCAWQRGRIRERDLDHACARLSRARPGQLRVVAMHHPLVQPPETGKAPMAGAAHAAQALAEAGADVVLCGHLHQWAAAPYALHEGGRTMLCVQAGTTLSDRLRGEENDFNQIDFRPGEVTVTRHATQGDGLTFHPGAATPFRQSDLARGWLAPPAPPPPEPPSASPHAPTDRPLGTRPPAEPPQGDNQG